MSDHCRITRAVLLAGESKLPAEAGGQNEHACGHLERCSECAAWARRLETLSRILRSAPSETPVELDGLVVAALQSGARQERAVRAVGDLGSLPAPEALAERQGDRGLSARPALVHSLAGPSQAPDVLERLVAEKVADATGAAATRRSLEILGRQPVPRALDRRIARLLGSLGRFTRPVAGLAAASLVAFLVIPLLRPVASDDPQSAASAYSFRVVRGSIGDLDPLARRMLDDVTGGALLVRERQR